MRKQVLLPAGEASGFSYVKLRFQRSRWKAGSSRPGITISIFSSTRIGRMLTGPPLWALVSDYEVHEMKLAIVTSYFPLREQPYRGRTAYKVALELRQWMDVEAICPFAHYPQWLQPKSFPQWRIDPNFTPGGIRTTYLEYPALPGLTRITNGVVCAHLIKPFVRRVKPDVLQSYFIYPDGYAAVRVGRQLGIPVVLVAIGSDLNRIPDKITERFTRRALANASHVMTMGRDLRQQAVRLGARPDRISSYKNGCDTEIFHLRNRGFCRSQLNVDPTAALVVCVGRLDMLKGLGELLEAAAKVVPQYPSLRVAYLGDGPALSGLEDRARHLGIRPNVIFTGACDSETVARWLGACNVFAMPSYAEGSPNVIIEALNCGRPVVASRVGGIPELFDTEAGILIPARDAQALAKAIIQALKKPWDEVSIARCYRRSWLDLAKEMASVLESVAASASLRRI
jgi:teichuronic acid biosynthesis glycosyltransferase TuaC